MVHSSSESHVMTKSLYRMAILGGIIIVLTTPPIIDPFPAKKPPLYHKDTTKGRKCLLVGGFECLELCLYGIRELA